MSLASDLAARGLNVKTVTGWGTRGGTWAAGKPVAVMEHHTAPPVPYPVDRLYGDLLKCNINVKPDGTVWLVAARACNYSSGSGSSIVLAEARRGTPPTANARERGLHDDVNGNVWFFNFECDHAGDGGPIPAVQHDAIVAATQVVLDHYGLGPGNVISHAEWTARKRDPYWNGSLRAIDEIRAQLALTPLEDDMPLTDEDLARIRQAVRDETGPAVLGAEYGGPVGSPRRMSHAQHILNIETLIGAVDAEGVSEAELDERVDRLIATLPDAVLARLKSKL